MKRVLVVGGGLAGIVAALDCADAGAQVTLVEVRRRLGGAAYSFERDGLTMDNGQHVFLRCCEAYRALLQRLGSTHLVNVQDRLDIPVLSPGRQPVRLSRGNLPAPLHLAASLLRYPHLSLAGRLGAARAALALGRLDLADPRLEDRTFGAWLERHGQDRRAIGALWDLIALPTLNVPATEASLALAAFVFQEGLLAGADRADIGFHVGTLQEILGDPARRALEQAGVEIKLGWRAQELRPGAKEDSELFGPGVSEPGRHELSVSDGSRAGRPALFSPDNPGPVRYELSGRDASGSERLSGEAVVVALPHDRSGALLEGLLGPNAGLAGTPGSSPIVNLHVVYDRRVLDEPFAAGVGTPVQYLFDRGEAAGAPPGCQYLAVSLSGAAAEMEMSVAALRERYLPAMAALLPRARDANVERFQVTREHAATFRASPGVSALRPAARTGHPGLALAGAWTDTGWPATLEGAVLSGHSAARVVLGSIGLGHSGAGSPGGGRAPVAVRG